MPLIAYKKYTPNGTTPYIINEANKILEEYDKQGFNLTLRQLYYQFIARDLFPDSYKDRKGTKNNVKSYNKLGRIIASAREGGYIDWNYITDRGRRSKNNPHWENPQDFIDSVVPQFGIDLWWDQNYRVEVWVEKDALSDVIARACAPLDIPFMVCKGYMSASAMWESAYNRMYTNWEKGQNTIVLHLGDHDPSGIDMSRDIQDRLHLYVDAYGDLIPEVISVERIALTMDQIEDQEPPPNPSKESDPRFKTYWNEYGDESWELDALEPQFIVDLIIKESQKWMDVGKYNKRIQLQKKYLKQLGKVSDRWEDIAKLIK